jgi:hypothetical protein
MSARSNIQGPSEAPFRMPTTPVLPTFSIIWIFCNFFNSETIRAAVSISSKRVSGF